MSLENSLLGYIQSNGQYKGIRYLNNKIVLSIEDYSRICTNLNIIVATKEKYHSEILSSIEHYGIEKYLLLSDQLIRDMELFISESNEAKDKAMKANDIFPKTICGKYSYGPLCNHFMVEKCGAFCSFAEGTDVLTNHPINYITTHPIAYADKNAWIGFKPYSDRKDEASYSPGIIPKGKITRKRITIGNDVWMGKNVLITNYSNIGNGVIAGAGAVITKDIPDYAVVVGVPAKIIRYRYTKDQIMALNQIAWWDWPDDKIVMHYDDLLGNIDDFIEKHAK